MENILTLSLLAYITPTVPESLFACDNSTIRPNNGLPYYQIIYSNKTHSEAESECRSKGAELLSVRSKELLIGISGYNKDTRTWLSVKKRYWIHDSLDLGLAFESWAAGHPTNADGMCAYAKRENGSVSLYPAPCSTKRPVICTSRDLGVCEGEYIYDYMCYFTPDGSIFSRPFEKASAACAEQLGHLVAIFNQKQMEWLADTFTDTFWTGHCYNRSNTNLYWHDGQRVASANWKVGQPLGGDCVVIDGEGQWQTEDCDNGHNFICTLDVPYATQPATCAKFSEECVCYWTDGTSLRFDKAMERCMSGGGTLAYPNSERKQKAFYSPNYHYWVGISDGHTRGVLRGTDGLPVTWIKWPSSYGPTRATNYDCVRLGSSVFQTFTCNTVYRFTCQSLPDSYKYSCNKTSGCLRAQDFWDVDNTDLVYEGTAKLQISNVKTFDICWDMCVNYIAFICVVITYDIQTRECSLFSEATGEWISGSEELISRNRTRHVVDPSSYCLKKLDGLATFEEAINRCADYETGWRLPVIMDRQMIERMIWDAWISAKGTSELPWLYKTLEDDYLPYAGWNSNQPSLTADPCVCISNHAMSTYRCTSPLSVVCYTETADICSGSPNIVHGTKTVNDTHVVYVCDEGYFMSSLNVTDVTIKCDCEGSTRLQDIDNCTAIECALPQSNSFGTVINMTGLEVNNQVLYRCPDGQQIPATKSRYYTLTCTQVRGTTTAVWSAPPLCQVMRCEGMPDVINGRFSMTDNSFGSVIEFVCNAWYWIPEMGNNRVNITCTLDDSGLFVSWCWTPPCEEIICPEPPHIPMASYVRESNKAVYTCEPNYRIKGALSNKTEVVCQYDDNFTTTWVHLPTCEVITCSDVPEVEDATIVLPAGDNCTDSVVTYQCNNGYIIYQDGRPIYSDKRTFNKTCRTDYSTFIGKWTGNYSCEIPRCDLPQELPNSHLTDASRQVGGTANYSCNDNYAVTSTGKRWTSSVCLFEDDDQLPHWTTADNCSLIQCKQADNISNAIMINSSTNIGDVTVYRCLTGYRVKRAESANKEFVIYCQLDDSQSSASWTEAAGCEAVMCSAPPSVLNSQVTVSGHKVGDKARYVCDRSGSNRSWESTCVLDDVNQTMAVWKPIEQCTAISDDDLVTTTSAMSITRDLDTTTSISVTSRDGPLIRQCSNPDTVSGAVVKYRDLFINSRVMYVALPGYVFPNGGKSRSFVCLSGADWSTEARDLKRKRCSKLPEVTGAIKSTEENYVGTEVKIQCINSEAKMENGLSVLWTRCTYSEQWTFIPGKCDTQRCDPFEVVNNSRLIAYNNSVGGVSVIKCNLSYRFADGDQTKSFRCLSSLEWQQREPCYLAVCPRLRVPVNGAISTEKAMEGVLVEVTCKPGFMFPDKSTKKIIICNSTFNWNDTTGDCQIIRCRELPELMNGNMTSSDTLYNSSVTYICDVGYRLEYGYRQMTVRCDENAEWTLDPLTCKSDRCPPVPEVDNAVASTHEAINGTIVIYTCYKGHLLPNNDSHLYISCNGSDWNITQTSCSKVTCPQLMLTHAILFGNGTTFGDLVNFTCDEGYIYGNKTDGVLKCEADAQWNGVTTGCMPIDCGVPPTVRYSVHSVPSSHKYGTTITYTCVSGFWFKRAITRQSVTCTRNGQWSDIIRSCTLITCPPIPVWDDMEWNSTDNSVGASVNVSCTRDEGKHFTISVCTANGEWKPALDNCKTERIVFEPETEEAQGAEGIGIVVGSVIAVLYIFVAISDAPIIFEAIKGSKTKKNK